MSASQLPALTAVAFQLIGVLDTYDGDVTAMIAAGNVQLYHKIGRDMDQMRTYSCALPALSVAWVELVICHFELAHGLWRLQQGKIAMAEMGMLRKDHRGCVHNLRQGCIRLIASQNDIGGPA